MGQKNLRDLSQIPLSQYPEFIKKLNIIQMRLFAALSRRAAGNSHWRCKENGRLYSIQRDIAWFGTPEQVVIKKQHNCTSDRTAYSGKFIPIVHEYLLIFRKDAVYMLPTAITVTREINWKSVKGLSWRSAVRMALEELGGKASLCQLYKELDSFAITKSTVIRRRRSGRYYRASRNFILLIADYGA